MIDCFTKSKHALNAFVLVIVGQLEFPSALNVSLHDGLGCYTLTSTTSVLAKTFSDRSGS